MRLLSLTPDSPDVHDLEGGDDDLHGGGVDARLHLHRYRVHVHAEVEVGPQVHELGRAVGVALVEKGEGDLNGDVIW